MATLVLAQTHRVGAHFKALNEAVLMAASKIVEEVFSISISPAGLCWQYK